MLTFSRQAICACNSVPPNFTTTSHVVRQNDFLFQPDTCVFGSSESDLIVQTLENRSGIFLRLDQMAVRIWDSRPVSCSSIHAGGWPEPLYAYTTIFTVLASPRSLPSSHKVYRYSVSFETVVPWTKMGKNPPYMTSAPDGSLTTFRGCLREESRGSLRFHNTGTP